MSSIQIDLVTWLKKWFYTESEINTKVGDLQTQINNKAEQTTVTALSRTVDGKADKSQLDNFTLYDEFEQTVGNKVDKVTGKGLSTNDFTNTYKSALDNLNNTIANAIGDLEIIEVVSSLPTASASTMDKMYVVLKSSGTTTNDIANVYITVKSGSTYSWEKLDLNVDLSNYATKSYAQNGDNQYIFTSSTSGNFENIRTPYNGNEMILGKNTPLSGAFLVLDILIGNMKSDIQSKANSSDLTNKANKSSTLGTTITLENKTDDEHGYITFNTN